MLDLHARVRQPCGAAFQSFCDHHHQKLVDQQPKARRPVFHPACDERGSRQRGKGGNRRDGRKAREQETEAEQERREQGEGARERISMRIDLEVLSSFDLIISTRDSECVEEERESENEHERS